MITLADKKILAILDKNSRLPTTQIAKKIGISREAITYRINRLEKLGIIKKFITQIDATKLGFGVFKLYVRFQNTDKEKKEEIFNWLKENEFVYWFAESRGKWDCNITIFAKNVYHFNEIYSNFINLFGPNIEEQEFNITTEVGILEKNWKIENQKRKIKKTYHQGIQKISLEKIEVDILKILANNARTKTTEISRLIKSSERIIRYKIKNLEKKEIILGYSISVDYDKAKKEFFKSTIKLNQLSEKLKNKIRKYCQGKNNIIYYVFCLGSWQLELEFITDNNKEYYDEMERIKEAIPEIKTYETLIFSKEYKFDWLPKIEDK
ncbi:MAG: winged helix-turn-helix transcriptional regulator [Nanoarchaeota archaeon]|jgi:DNA-binding Lrp family transcriptional regulator|nr:winged helix-turn-helix transcriptional regulator [Nanoarchaeota archaeon]